MIRRREFISLLGSTAVWPLAARAQQGERMRRIGVLMAASAGDPEYQSRVDAFQQGLAQLGWSEGRNVRLEIRWATTNADRIRAAAELVGLTPDDILASGDNAMPALRPEP